MPPNKSPKQRIASRADALPSRRKLLIATAIALIVGLLVTVLFVMPAEYGKDPTGFGRLTGVRNLYSQPAVADEEVFVPVNSTGNSLLSFNVSWVPREAAAGEHEGNLESGAVEQIAFTVTDANVTRMTAVLTWNDEAIGGQQTDPDTFQLNATSPTGETRSFMGRNSGPSGSLTAIYVVNGFPAPAQVTAANHEAALDAAHSLNPSRLEGTGEWTIDIWLVEAGGLPPLGVGDSGNAWTLRLFVETFTPALGDPQLTPIRQDTLELTIPARGQLEFKARMNETAAFTYDWSATGSLNYEFHGDAQGAQGDRFESYEKGTASGKTGDFKAPFTGRHGWYWQNTGVVDVQLTLKLRGDYVIVGIV